MARIAEQYNKHDILIWGDPAGNKRDEIYEVTAFDHLRSLGFKAQPTDTNAFQVRREAGASPMNRLVSGKPGIIVDKTCLRLRKSLSGGYFFKEFDRFYILSNIFSAVNSVELINLSNNFNELSES